MSIKEKIYIVVRDNPGATQSEIAFLLEESKQRVNYQVKKMEEMGVLQRRTGRDGGTKIHLSEGLEYKDIKDKVMDRSLSRPGRRGRRRSGLRGDERPTDTV